jgi:DNA repair protein RecO (recombination protein O)
VRKPASRKAGHLEPFTHVALLVARGRTWDIITQAETVTSFRDLREELDRTAYAYYFTELVDAFTEEEDSHPDLFDLLLAALGYLEQSPNLALTARWFELRILKVSGYEPQLFRCIECGEEIRPVTNYFSAERGGVLCPRHGEGVRGAEPIVVGALKVLRYLQKRPYRDIPSLQLTPARMRQLEKLLGDYIRYVL